MSRLSLSRRVRIASLSAAAVIALALSAGTQRSAAPAALSALSPSWPAPLPSLALSAADVRWAYMTWPIPAEMTSGLLLGGRDVDRLAKLLDWVRQAPAVDGRGLSEPIMGRSMALNVEFDDGRTLEIRPAWSCDSTDDQAGHTSIACKPVEDRVWIRDSERPDGGFAKSPPLYAFVNEGYKEWMPPVKPYNAPETVKAGEPFIVSGSGMRADKVTVALSLGTAKLWEGEAAVTEGDWVVAGTAPAGIAKGELYDLRIQADGAGYGVSVRGE